MPLINATADVSSELSTESSSIMHTSFMGLAEAMVSLQIYKGSPGHSRLDNAISTEIPKS